MKQAYYDDLNLIRLYTLEALDDDVYLFNKKCEMIQAYKKGIHYVYEIKTEKLELGTAVFLEIKNEQIRVIPRFIVKTAWFEETYDATDAVLGAFVQNNKTTFSVWSPVASKIFLKLKDKIYDMEKEANGIHQITIDENLHGTPYWYSVHINNETIEVTDPYAKASLPNRAGSVVVDFAQLDLNVHQIIPDAPIILEASVRDFSMDPKVPFEHRGQFLGMLESHNHYGLNHVLDLGVTYLQLMPVNDFETVNELDPLEKYNWGYDPMQSMVLEGSYSSNVHDPMQVILDFAKLVDTYHKQRIGINLDVVFNHVYDVDTHPFNVLVPYYYFRYDNMFNLSDGSFCGNEVASEMRMTRKWIVESIEYFVNTFKIDGFRFDLMGLIDIETMKEVHKLTSKVNPNIMIYGEGWQMPTPLAKENQATLRNQAQFSEIGHFNDWFRDSVAGRVNSRDLGYVGGNTNFTESMKSALVGYSDSSLREYLFKYSSQSINYVECHDNLTLADKVKSGNGSVDEACLATGIVIFAQGIPFLQIGQSFFRDKQGDSNSYNAGDEINHVPWQQLDQYRSMNDLIKTWIQLRKKMYRIKEGYSFKQEGDLLHYYYGRYDITLNPTDQDLDTYRKSLVVNIKET